MDREATRPARPGRARGRAQSRQQSGSHSRCRCSRRRMAVCPRSSSSSRALPYCSARPHAYRSVGHRKAHNRLRLPVGQGHPGFPCRVSPTQQANSSRKRVRPGRQDQRRHWPAAVRCHRATKRCSITIRPCKPDRLLPDLELPSHSNSASHHCPMRHLRWCRNSLVVGSILKRQLHSSSSRRHSNSNRQCRANRCSSSSRSSRVDRLATWTS